MLTIFLFNIIIKIKKGIDSLLIISIYSYLNYTHMQLIYKVGLNLFKKAIYMV